MTGIATSVLITSLESVFKLHTVAASFIVFLLFVLAFILLCYVFYLPAISVPFTLL